MPRKRSDGLYLRGRTWWLDARINGRRYQIRLGKSISRTVAAELAAVKRAQILRGEAGIRRKRKDIGFEDAKKLFLEWSEANRKPHTVTMHQGAMAKLSNEFSGKRLSQVTRFGVESYKRKRGAVARVRVNRELATLKSLFNHCREWGKFDGDNPVVGVKFLPEPKQRLRFLDHDEESRLLDACREPIRTIVLVGVHAGLRIQSEALTLTWGAVDLVRRQVTVLDAHAKNGESRTIPLNGKLCEALARLRAGAQKTGPADPVFVAWKDRGRASGCNRSARRSIPPGRRPAWLTA
ncbi:MAG: tyrosine-type recombinase/integrase [Vicinamibacteria bacterium]